MSDQQPSEVQIDVLDGEGDAVRTFSSTDDDELPASSGMHRLVWDLAYPGADVIPGSRLDGSIAGPKAVPGSYQIRLQVGDWSQTRSFEVLSDPRSESSRADLQEQFDFLLTLRNKITQTHDAVRTIHAIRDEIDAAHVRIVSAHVASTGAAAERDAVLERVAEAGGTIRVQLDDLEDRLRQKRATVWQDTANFEPLIDDQFAWVASYYPISGHTPDRFCL